MKLTVSSLVANTSGDIRNDLFVNWFNSLDNLSEGADDFSHFLDDWLGNGVLQHMRLILGMGFLVRTMRTFMMVLNIDVTRCRAEYEIDREYIGRDLRFLDRK